MGKKYVIALCLVISSVMISLANAASVTKEQIKGLDEQVQDIKKDVLAISSELNRLEEKLLYPSNTQISFFISLAENDKFEPSAVKLKFDDKEVSHYIYSFKELEALQSGGVQKVFTGNTRTGEHTIQVTVIGKQGGSVKKRTASHAVTKGVGPAFLEIRLSDSDIEFRKW